MVPSSLRQFMLKIMQHVDDHIQYVEMLHAGILFQDTSFYSNQFYDFLL